MKSNPQPCPHRNEIERLAWRRIKRIGNAMRKDGRTVPYGEGECRAVKRFLMDLVAIHGNRWMIEANAYVASMEQQNERRVA